MIYGDIILSTSLMIISIALLRKIFLYRVPSFVWGILWIFVCARALIPYPIMTRYNIYNTFYYCFFDSSFSLKARTPMNSFYNLVFSFYWKNRYYIIALWIIGMVCFCLIFFRKYLKIIKIQKSSMPLIKEREYKEFLRSNQLSDKCELRELAGLKSPIACGIMHPMIIFPMDFEKRYPDIFPQAFLHEAMHLRYRHSLIRLFSVIVLIVNWYNPIFWILYEFIDRDMEIACDRGAIKHLGIDYTATYAFKLVKYADMNFCHKSHEVTFYNGFSKNVLKERIVAIMKFKKFSIASIVVSMLIPTSIAFAMGPNDNYILGNEFDTGFYSIATETVFVEPSSADSTPIFVPWEELQPYTIEPETRAVDRINVREYRKEYSSFSSVGEYLEIVTTVNGHTYSGILTLIRIEREGSKFVGYYDGTIYLRD